MAKNLKSMFWLGEFLLRAVMENLFQASLLASSLLESVISLLIESLLMSSSSCGVLPVKVTLCPNFSSL